VGVPPLKGLQSQYSGQSGDFQALCAKISLKRQVLRYYQPSIGKRISLICRIFLRYGSFNTYCHSTETAALAKVYSDLVQATDAGNHAVLALLDTDGSFPCIRPRNSSGAYAPVVRRQWFGACMVHFIPVWSICISPSAKSAGGAENAGVESAGVDNVAPSSRGGKCGEIRRQKKK